MKTLYKITQAQAPMTIFHFNATKDNQIQKKKNRSKKVKGEIKEPIHGS